VKRTRALNLGPKRPPNGVFFPRTIFRQGPFKKKTTELYKTKPTKNRLFWSIFFITFCVLLRLYVFGFWAFLGEGSSKTPPKNNTNRGAGKKKSTDPPRAFAKSQTHPPAIRPFFPLILFDGPTRSQVTTATCI
jgi:hypothetical protein